MAGPRSVINRSILSSPSLVFIGLISYPLYLWHWPILSYAHIMSNGLPLQLVMILLATLSLVLAILTYIFIEKPIKNLSIKVKSLTSVYILGGLILIGALGHLASLGKISPNSSSKGLDLISDASDDWDFPGRLTIMDKNTSAPYFVQGSNTAKTIFIGDSNIQQYYPRMEKILAEEPRAQSVIIYTGGKCPPIPSVRHDGKYSVCSTRIEKGFHDALTDESIKDVVIGAQWTSYFKENIGFYISQNKVKLPLESSQDIAMIELKKIIRKLRSLNKNVYVILNIPVGEAFDPSSNVKRKLFKGVYYEEKNITRNEFETHFQTIFSKLEAAAIEAGANIINPLDLLCAQEYCTISLNGIPIYKDTSHLRPFYVIQYAQFIDQTMVPGT